MNVLVVDDHPLYRQALRALMMGLDPAVELFEAGTVPEALECIGRCPPLDLILLDMKLPGSSRLDALAAVREAAEAASVVVVSAEEEPSLILRTIEAGAAGYIPKSTDQAIMINALRIVLAHGTYLPPAALQPAMRYAGDDRPAPRAVMVPEFSQRQRAVLHCLLQGKANKVIARELDIAEGTVKAHLAAVYQLLGVASRVQAMCRVHELGLLDRLG